MPYECNDCGMDFETTAELANHKKRFCKEGNYGDLEQLDKRMGELRNSRNEVDFNYKARLAGKRPAGPVSAHEDKPLMHSQSQGRERENPMMQRQYEPPVNVSYDDRIRRLED